MPVTASKTFERPHIDAGVYDATIVAWRETTDDGKPLQKEIEGRMSTFGVLDFDIAGKTIGRMVGLKLNERSILGKIYIALGVKFLPGETHDPAKDLIGKKCLVNVIDTTVIDRLSGKPVTVSKVDTVMPPKKGGRA